jgi:hypothetical protein
LITKRHFTIALWMPVRLSANYPGIFERMRQSMMRRFEMCIESHWHHLSTYCKYTLSAVTHKLNVTGHVWVWTVSMYGIRSPICPYLSVASCTSLCRPTDIILDSVHYVKSTWCTRLYGSYLFSFIHANGYHWKERMDIWRMPSSGMWRRVDLVWTDVTEEGIAPILRVEKSASEES